MTMWRRNKKSRAASNRRLQAEALEPRMVLSANGLVPVGTQPQGALTGRVVYAHAGHGWTAENLTSGVWLTQRPETFEMIEDLGNQDQLTFFADELFRAGATVVPLRPVGHQPNEVVLDNDDVEVTFSGAWSNSSSSIYYGDFGDIPYRFASTSNSETAYARYRPNIPSAGHYPIYAWTRHGSDRAGDQLYRVNHTGGITEVTINHRRVGNGLVYLGTYYFDEGTDGYVDISNRSSESGRVVIADMIRFGNGMGDIDRGGGVSGFAREDEAGLYWVKWHVDRSQGIPDSEYRASADDRTATVSLSPRYAEYMNRQADGDLEDRVFVSFHSNAGGGTARGVLALYNGNNTPATATPNQFLLADTLGREVNDDMVSLNGSFEHNWANRTTVTLDRSDIEFGEINNFYAQDEFDATIVETGFHDNQQDAEMLRDPRVREALARATYQGVVRYFNTVDPTTLLTMNPAPVSELSVESPVAGLAVLNWNPSVASAALGDSATGYRVYVSTDGYGFDGGTLVPGGSTNAHVLTGLDPDTTYYIRIAAVNNGGESKGSEVVAVRPNAAASDVLVVNGFDRFDRTLNPRVTYGSRTVDRVRPRYINSFDYAVQVASAITEANPSLRIDTASNESIINGSISLLDYDSVIWISGEESSADSTYDATEQSLVQSYLAAGGNLFASGSEIGWDLDNLNNGRSFYNNVLRADYVADDANTYNVTGTVGSIFDGVSTFSFDDGSQFYDVTFPDVVAPVSGSTAAMQYVGGVGGTAAIQFDPGTANGRIVMFGFPFETISAASTRTVVMERVLEFFDQSFVLAGDFDGDGDLDCTDALLLSAGILNGTAEDLNGDGNVDGLDIQFWATDLRQTRLGDANLDGIVDAQDFDIWTANRFSTSTYFCTGDFNGDFATDLADLHVLNENFSLAAPPLTTESSHTDTDKRPREIKVTRLLTPTLSRVISEKPFGFSRTDSDDPWDRSDRHASIRRGDLRTKIFAAMDGEKEEFGRSFFRW